MNSQLKKMMNVFACLAVCAMSTGAAFGDTPWGVAYKGGVQVGELTARTASGGICLDDADLAAINPNPDEIRFVSGELFVDHLEVTNRTIAFVGADEGEGTTLKPDAYAVREFGGALAAVGGSVTVSNLVFQGFAAETAGGALLLQEMTGDCTVADCVFIDCEASPTMAGFGGAIYVSADASVVQIPTLTVRDSRFASCAAACGGAITSERIYPYDEKSMALYITGSIFEHNESTYSGGALWVEGDTTLANTRLAYNRAGSDGGAVCAGTSWADDSGYAGFSVRSLDGVVFEGNEAHDAAYPMCVGGAVATMSPGIALCVTRTAFLANKADMTGGAIFAYTGSVSIVTSVFSNNVVTAEGYSTRAGAVAAASCTSFAMTNVTVRGSRSGAPGAVYLYMTPGEVVNCVVLDNKIGQYGRDKGIANGCEPGKAPMPVILKHSAYGTIDGSFTKVDCLENRTAADFDGTSLRLRGSPYNPVAAEGLVQDATDFEGVAYGSRPYGYSMGAYECATESCVSSEPFAGVYDGGGHTITVAVATSVVPITWLYSTESATGPWVDYNPAFTNVGTYWVWACASSAVFKTSLVTSNTVAITKRDIVLVSASAEAPYVAGRMLMTNEVWVSSVSNALAAGDALTYQCTGSQQDVGESDNTFTYDITNAVGVSVADNYAVTPQLGTLTVVPGILPNPESKPSVGPEYKPDEPGPQYPPAPTNDVGVLRTLSDFDCVETYSGTGWTIDTNKLWQAVTDKAGSCVVTNLEYSLDGTVWQAAPFYYTNVVATSFWYRAGIENYSNYYHSAGVTITQRVVAVSFVPNDKIYDTTDVATCSQTNFDNVVSGESFMLAEGVHFTFDTPAAGLNKTVTANPFDADHVQPGPNTLKENYTFQFVPTAPASISRAGGIVFEFTDEAENRYYTSAKVDPSVCVRDGDGRELGVTEYEVEYYADIHATNSADKTTWSYAVVTMTNNYEGVVTNYYAIKPRVLTVTTEGQTFVYNGSAQSNAVVTVVGLQENDAIVTNSFTEVTAVNEPDGVKNVFGYGIAGEANATDYAKVETWGTLVVVPGKMPDPDPDPEDPENPRDPKVGPHAGPNLPEPTVPPVPTNKVDGTWSVLSDYDVVTNYDGVAHTFDVTALSNKLDGLDFKGNKYALAYSLTGADTTWQENPFEFTDVTATSFWYRVAVPNYTNYIHAVGVTVTQRVVRVVLPTATKIYDGTPDLPEPLVTNISTVAENMVAGERFDVIALGKFASALAGTPDLILTNVTLTATKPQTKFGNYKIYFGKEGKVLFNPTADDPENPPSFGPEDPNWPQPGDPNAPDLDVPGEIMRKGGIVFDFADDPEQRYYRAEFVEPGVEVYDETLLLPTSEYKVEYFANLHATNSADRTTWPYAVVTLTNNYEGVVTNYFVIKPQPLALVTEGTNFVFNGTWQSNAVVAITGLCAGAEKDRVVAYGFEAVKTVTNNVPNVFYYELAGKLRAGDYAVTETWGMLNVLAALPPKPEEDDPSGPHPNPPQFDPEDPNPPCVPGVDEVFSDFDTKSTYDGEAHTLDTNALVIAVSNAVAQGQWLGATPVVTYSLDGVHWQEAPFDFVDATVTSLWYKVSAPNFQDCVHAVAVKIDPRPITIVSGSKTAYLPTTGGSVVASNGFTWVASGTFVVNARTGLKDDYVATVPTFINSSVPTDEKDNAFSVSISPGLDGNYAVSNVCGKLKVESKPQGQTLIYEDVSDATGRGCIRIIMDNTEAGSWAADMPEQLRKVASHYTQVPGEMTKIILKVSDTNTWDHTNWENYYNVTNDIVATNINRGVKRSIIDKYRYSAFDITLNFVREPDAAAATTNNIGHANEEMLTINVPCVYESGMTGLQLWRNHSWTNEMAVLHRIEELGNGVPTTQWGESFTTNEVGYVLSLSKFSELVAVHEFPAEPKLECGALTWKYAQSENAFYAGLAVSCVDGEPKDLRNLCFLYEDDLNGCYLRDLNSSAKLSDTHSRYYSGTKFGVVELTALENAIRQAEKGVTQTTGVSSATIAGTRKIVPTGERLIALACTAGLKELFADITREGTCGTSSILSAYLVWEDADGGEHWLAIGADAEAVNARGAAGEIVEPIPSAKSVSASDASGTSAVPSAFEQQVASLSAPASGSATVNAVSAAEAYVKARTLTAVVVDETLQTYVGTAKISVGKISKKGALTLSAKVTLFTGKSYSAKQTIKPSEDDASAVGTLAFKNPLGSLDFELGYDADAALCRFAAEGNGYRLIVDETGAVGGALEASTCLFNVAGLDELAVPSGYAVLDEALPADESIYVKGTKWSFDKATAVKYVKDAETKTYELVGLGGTNVSGLKLSYTSKTGLFSGTFKIYATNAESVAEGKKPTLKKYTAKVKGVVVNGQGYGLVTIKIGSNTSYAVCTIEAE